MYNPYKGIFSEMSWTLEYHYGIHSAYATLFIMSIGLGALLWLFRKVLLHFKRRTWTWAPPALSILLLFRINSMCSALYTCSTRLKNILGNLEVVAASDTYAKAFLSSIGVLFNEKTKASIASIAYFLNKEQWKEAMEKTGNIGWYFGKAGINLLEITNLFGCHVSVPAIKQGIVAYIPAAVICGIGVYILKKKKRIAEGILYICLSGLCVISSFGAAFTVMFAILWYFLICSLRLPTKARLKEAVKI